MRDDKFEWDDRKAQANLAWHRVSFQTARLAFDDPYTVKIDDRREDYGEDRYVLVGMVQHRLLAVAIRCAASVPASSRPARPSSSNDDSTMKRTAKTKADVAKTKIDWTAFDAMTAEERHAA